MYLIDFPPVTNRADWTFALRVTDPSDGSEIEIDDVTAIELALRHPRSCEPVLTASVADGRITFPEASAMQWRIPSSYMRDLRPAVYEVGMTLTKDGEVEQIFLGHLQVKDGIVS